VDGDFDSERTVALWMDLLASRPDIRCYGYSKSWELLWAFAQQNTVPANYLLNLSSGGRPQAVSKKQMQSLPFVRGDFVALSVGHRPKGGREVYGDPEYHRAVRAEAARVGLGKVFSCPDECGSCCAGKHACGSARLKGVTVVIGIH
jgi:hypothetical protein